MAFDLQSLLTNTLVSGSDTFGLTDLEQEVLLALCLEAEGAFLPVTSDGRFARAAFGRDLDLAVVGRTATGVQVQERTHDGVAADGAPSAHVYTTLVHMGLARDSLDRCAWVPTASGKAVAADL